jgi:hypothetical protein
MSNGLIGPYPLYGRTSTCTQYQQGVPNLILRLEPAMPFRFDNSWIELPKGLLIASVLRPAIGGQVLL